MHNQTLHEDQPSRPAELPPRPWSKLGVDLVGPIQYILMVIDYYASYSEAVVISDISSETVTREFMRTFARFGHPLGVITDNGRQFVGQLFESFLRTGRIKRTSVTFFPKEEQENRALPQILKEGLRAAKSEGKSWKEELLKSFLAYLIHQLWNGLQRL